MPLDGLKYLILFFFACTALFPLKEARAADDSARVYFLHALKSKQEGNFLSAENLFRNAIELEPQNADFHFELGNLYAERENLPSARFEFEQAVMMAPSHLAAHYNLGLVYSEMGLTGEARDHFRRVRELDAQNVRAQIQIGRTYAQEGFFDDARQAFEEAREMDPLSPESDEALEDLARSEAEAKMRSRSELEQSFDRNRRSFDLLNSRVNSLGAGSSGIAQTSPAALSGKDVLTQAGVLLIQQLMSRRSKSSQDSQDSSQF